MNKFSSFAKGICNTWMNMKTFLLRRRLLEILVVLISGTHVMAQSGPLVPKTFKAKTTNSVLLYKVFGAGVNIPIYLTSARNVSIKYCWYSTEMVYGERVRTSENPYRVEEGTYTNGRLTTYVKEGYAYYIEWGQDGEIYKIRKYNQTTGGECDAVRYYDGDNINGIYNHNLWLDNGKSIHCPGKGLVCSSSIYMPREVLLTAQTAGVDYRGDSYKSMRGFKISSQCLCRIEKWKHLRRLRGTLTRQWVDDNVDKQLVKIMDNGSFYSKNVYDVKDEARCAEFVN